jgi:hypothetical protein
MDTSLTGGCLCGAVRYTAVSAPLAVRQCYCRTCQYISAGSPSVNMMMHAADVTFTGELREYVSTADSGNIMHRRFCPVCGTPVSNQAESRPQFIVMRVGTLDDPNAVAPSTAIWVSAAPRWACIDPALTHVDKQPVPPTAR